MSAKFSCRFVTFYQACFILAEVLYRKKKEYALENTNFKQLGRFKQIRATYNHWNVEMKVNRTKINVDESRGISCLSCALLFLAAKDPNLFDTASLDSLLMEGKVLAAEKHRLLSNIFFHRFAV